MSLLKAMVWQGLSRIESAVSEGGGGEKSRATERFFLSWGAKYFAKGLLPLVASVHCSPKVGCAGPPPVVWRVWSVEPS